MNDAYSSTPRQPEFSIDGEFTAEEKNWAILAHVTNVAGVLLSAGFLAWLGPLVILLTKGSESRLVAQHARETLNWCLSALVAKVVFITLAIVTFGLGVLLLLPVLFLLWAISLYGGVMGGIKADRGEFYTYPLSHPFLKGEGQR